MTIIICEMARNVQFFMHMRYNLLKELPIRLTFIAEAVVIVSATTAIKHDLLNLTELDVQHQKILQS